jgi:hypothetical protein
MAARGAPRRQQAERAGDVEEVSATTVLYPGDEARVDAIGSLVVEIGR